MVNINRLLRKYQKYIDNNFIKNYRYLYLSILRENIESFRQFILNNQIDYGNNITFRYFYGLYLFCVKDYNRMMETFVGINEPNILNLLGYYHMTVSNDEETMRSCFISAARAGNSNAMYNLAQYSKKKRDYKNMKKYYNMAIDYGNIDAAEEMALFYENKDRGQMLDYAETAANMGSIKMMRKLANYYRYKNYYEDMKDYYLMAIEKNCSISMYELGIYYDKVENNAIMMLGYLTMAIKLKNADAMCYLAEYYIQEEKNILEMIKYYEMAISHNCNMAAYRLGMYYESKAESTHDGEINEYTTLMKEYYICAINMGCIYSIYNLKQYCLIKEQNEQNYYKYLYLPRFLTLILCLRRYNNKNEKKYKNTSKNTIERKIIFLPEEILYHLIFMEYMQW